MTTEEIRKIVKDAIEPTCKKVDEMHAIIVTNGLIAKQASLASWVKAHTWAIGGLGLLVITLLIAML